MLRAEMGYACREVHEHISVPKSFVYVYDMPSKFTSDILDLPTIWHPEQYDIDQVGPHLSADLAWPSSQSYNPVQVYGCPRRTTGEANTLTVRLPYSCCAPLGRQAGAFWTAEGSALQNRESELV